MTLMNINILNGMDRSILGRIPGHLPVYGVFLLVSKHSVQFTCGSRLMLGIVHCLRVVIVAYYGNMV